LFDGVNPRRRSGNGNAIFIAASRLLALCLVLALAAAADDAIPVPLLESIVVHHEKLLLSDFLPRDAPESLRAQAAQVTLGHLPSPGTNFARNRAELQRQLDSELLRRLQVPVRIQASRPSYRLDPEQVRSALESALHTRGVQVSLRDLEIGATPTGDTRDPQLRVLDIRRDVLHHTWDARVVLANAPGSLPFLVTASDTEPWVPLQANSKTQPAPPVKPLLKAGQHATLWLNDAGFQAMIPVVCLEMGFPGKEIRVRDEFSGKVHRALVSDNGDVQGNGGAVAN
jgi:hypothetical protein